MPRTLTLSLALSLGLIGCHQESGEPTPPAPPAAPRAPAAPPGPRAEADTFELVATPEGDGYAVGQLGQFAIQLSPKGRWHVNVEYPIRVTLHGPDDVAFAKQELVASDAAELAEARARFDVPFTPGAPGEHEVRADVSFGLCEAESCIFEDRTLALPLAVR